MPRTPDRFPGEADEEGAILEPSEADPTIEGGIRFVSGSFRMKDGSGVFNPRSGGGGITADDHKVLRQLIHFLDEGPGEGFLSGAFKEIIGGVFPTAVIWWESSAKLKKLVEKIIDRTDPVRPTPITWKVYASDGSTVLATVQDAITYSGISETSRTRTITV